VAQQFAILPPSKSNAAAGLGGRKDLIAALASLNTGPERPGEDLLWGPGFQLELTPNQDPVQQMLLTITEDEIAWLAIMRLARQCQWRIIDLETGQEIEPE
jgi:hypothetical protein